MPKGRIAEILTGRVFGFLTVLDRASNNRSHVRWHCQCQCGRRSIVKASALRRGDIKSCGCYAHGLLVKRNTTHGQSRTPEYFAWAQAKARCSDTDHPAYADYGARGIRMCDRWRDSFEMFYADMGVRPTSKHTLDRGDNDKGYEPGNCRWVTFQIQHNNRRGNKLVQFRGETHTIAEWARIVDLPVRAVYQRFSHGWDTERALTTPRLR